MRVDDPVKMANIFDQYFVNVGSILIKQFPEQGSHLLIISRTGTEAPCS